MKITRTLITLAAAVGLTASTWAAIPVPSGIITFDTVPAVADWSTRSLTGNQGDFSSTNLVIQTVEAMNAAISTNAASTIATAVPSNNGNPPGTAALAQWSTNKYVQTRPTGNAATMLMATLTNTTAADVSTLNISYTLASPITPTREELPGHRLYYNLSGAAGSWTAVGNYGVVGPQNIVVDLSTSPWAVDTQMYLLFVDDNSVTNTDGSYQIDNFQVTAGAAPLSVVLAAPADGANFSSCATVAATAGVGGVPTSLDYVLDGSSVDHRTGSPWSPSTLTGLSIGSHTIYVTATDGATTVYSATNTFTISANAAPTIGITNTFANGLTNGPGAAYQVGTCITNQLLVADSDGTVTNVNWYVNGALRLSIATGNRNTILLNDSLAGTNELFAVATDNCGLSTTSAVVSVVVTNPADISVIVPNGSTWSYHNTNFGPAVQGSIEWYQAGYDASTWLTGAGELGGGDASNGRGNYNGTDANNPETTPIDIGPGGNHYLGIYFRHTFTVSNPSQYTNLIVRALRDDGIVVYLNGNPIFTNQMDPGPFSYTNLASGTANDGVLYFNGNVNPTNLISGLNVLAAEVHQDAAGSSDTSFDLMLWGQGGAVSVPDLAIANNGNGTYTLSYPGVGAWRVFQTSDIGTPRASWSLTGVPVFNALSGRSELIVLNGSGNLFFDLRP